MKKLFLFVLLFFSFILRGYAQTDSLDNERLAKMINLSEVVVRTDINVPKFIDRVKNDTTFYKAFKNLHVLGFTALNDIRIMDKKDRQKAGMQSKTRQVRENGCRTTEIISETTQGNFYNSDREYNYYTAELYAGLFFTNGKICGENNIVKGTSFDAKGKSGVARHKEQLKMLFFNPGKKIPGIPFIGNKINVFDPDVAAYYDFMIDQVEYGGKPCYLFSVKAREDLSGGERDKIVIDNMITWFDAVTMEVLARNYSLSYDAGVYDFDVSMEVEMTKLGDYLVPKTLRYKGNWDVVFKKRERGVFTATLFDFKN
ncbi:hypothetical protein [Terrimonas pollutisoli]|uniref:hypothetical protein n=1 Tax=Terrimonas pollutisoli TaxID=3034147 RepID=UPI0023EB52A1|nr:hypothetical protein [Terrimonas sp. H1YJ31]